MITFPIIGVLPTSRTSFAGPPNKMLTFTLAAIHVARRRTSLIATTWPASTTLQLRSSGFAPLSKRNRSNSNSQNLIRINRLRSAPKILQTAYRNIHAASSFNAASTDRLLILRFTPSPPRHTVIRCLSAACRYPDRRLVIFLIPSHPIFFPPASILITLHTDETLNPNARIAATTTSFTVCSQKQG